MPLTQVCELDLYVTIRSNLIRAKLLSLFYSIFNFQKAYAVRISLSVSNRIQWLMIVGINLQMLDELIMAGELQETSKKAVLRAIAQSDQIEEQENSEDTLSRLGSRAP